MYVERTLVLFQLLSSLIISRQQFLQRRMHIHCTLFPYAEQITLKLLQLCQNHNLGFRVRKFLPTEQCSQCWKYQSSWWERREIHSNIQLWTLCATCNLPGKMCPHLVTTSYSLIGFLLSFPEFIWELYLTFFAPLFLQSLLSPFFPVIEVEA